MTAQPIFIRRPEQGHPLRDCGTIAAIRRIEGADMQAAWRDHVAGYVLSEAERLERLHAMRARLAEVPPITRAAAELPRYRRARDTALACVVVFCAAAFVGQEAMRLVGKLAGWW